MQGQQAPRRSVRLAAAAEGGSSGLILTDLAPDALALIYSCLGKEDRWSLMHSCKYLHSLPQLRAMVGGWSGWVWVERSSAAGTSATQRERGQRDMCPLVLPWPPACPPLLPPVNDGADPLTACPLALAPCCLCYRCTR